MHQKRQDGYLAAVLGGATGAVALMNLGKYLGTAYGRQFMPNAELEGLIPVAIGWIGGWWVGEVLGCWLVLHWLAYRDARLTATWLAGLTPFGMISLLFLLQKINPENQQLRPLIIGLIVIALPLVARLLTTRSLHRQG